MYSNDIKIMICFRNSNDWVYNNYIIDTIICLFGSFCTIRSRLESTYGSSVASDLDYSNYNDFYGFGYISQL